MAVINAAEASEIVRDFLTKMGWSTFVTPRKAEQEDLTWVIEFVVGFKIMQFEVNAETGEIIRYVTIDA